MGGRRLEIDGHAITLSRVEKVLFPEAGLSKGDLVDYHRDVAGVLLPHLEDRPLSLQRFPDGIDAAGFYQKKVPGHFPSWIGRTTVEVKEDGSDQEQVVCGDAATLVYLVDQAVVTFHPWPARKDRLDRPDRMIFDLDPPGSDFAPVRKAATDLKDLLDEVGLPCFVMTTGSKGLHVVVPLERRQGFDAVRALARDLAAILARRRPERYTIEPRKEARRGRLFLDYLRNAHGQTSVAPYAVRARAGAPVACPLTWSEVGESGLDARRWRVENVRRRLAQRDDPWRDLASAAARLEKAREAVDALLQGA